MNAINEITLYLVRTGISIYLLIMLLRFVLQLTLELAPQKTQRTQADVSFAKLVGFAEKRAEAAQEAFHASRKSQMWWAANSVP